MTNGEKLLLTYPNLYVCVLYLDFEYIHLRNRKINYKPNDKKTCIKIPLDWWDVEYTEVETGHWIFKYEGDRECLIYTCDKCGEEITIYDDTIKSPQEGHYNYCPNCGNPKMVEP